MLGESPNQPRPVVRSKIFYESFEAFDLESSFQLIGGMSLYSMGHSNRGLAFPSILRAGIVPIWMRGKVPAPWTAFSQALSSTAFLRASV